MTQKMRNIILIDGSISTHGSPFEEVTTTVIDKAIADKTIDKNDIWIVSGQNVYPYTENDRTFLNGAPNETTASILLKKIQDLKNSNTVYITAVEYFQINNGQPHRAFLDDLKQHSKTFNVLSFGRSPQFMHIETARPHLGTYAYGKPAFGWEDIQFIVDSVDALTRKLQGVLKTKSATPKTDNRPAAVKKAEQTLKDSIYMLDQQMKTRQANIDSNTQQIEKLKADTTQLRQKFRKAASEKAKIEKALAALQGKKPPAKQPARAKTPKA